MTRPIFTIDSDVPISKVYPKT